MRLRRNIIIRSSINIKETIGTLSVAIFLVLTIWTRILSINQHGLTIANIFLLVAGLIGIAYIFLDGRKNVIAYLGFIILSWLLEFIVHKGNPYYNIMDFGNSIFFLGIAYILVSCGNNAKIYRFIYYVVALFFIVSIVILKKPIRGILADGTTYNYISCYLVLFFSIYAYKSIQHGLHPTYFDSILLLISVVNSYGRGGIVAVAFYTIGYIFIKLHEKKTKPLMYLFVSICIIAMIVFSNKILEAFLGDANFRKFVLYGMDSNGRSELWGAYISETVKDIEDFAFGANPLRFFTDGNLHNSFLQMWGSLGFAFFATNIFLLFRLSYKKFKKNDWYFLLIMWTFIVRAFTDKMMYRWYGEILMYAFLLELFISEKARSVHICLKNSAHGCI